MSVIGVCSGKGSPGATFVAVNLAAALARRRSILLVDLDPAGGDVGAYLGLDPRRSVYPLVRLNASLLLGPPESLLAEAQERGGVAAVCGFPDPCAESTVWKLPDIVRVARRSGRTVIVDLGRVADRTAAVAAEADWLLVVVRPDLVAVAGAERALRQLRATEFPMQRVRAVICGIERRRPADLAEVASVLRVPIVGVIPFDRRGARAAMIAQNPVAKGRVARAFANLAGALADDRQGEAASEATASVATV